MVDEVIVRCHYYLSKYPTRKNGYQRPGKHRVRNVFARHILSPWRPNRNTPVKGWLEKLPPLIVQPPDPFEELVLTLAILATEEREA